MLVLRVLVLTVLVLRVLVLRVLVLRVLVLRVLVLRVLVLRVPGALSQFDRRLAEAVGVTRFSEVGPWFCNT